MIFTSFTYYLIDKYVIGRFLSTERAQSGYRGLSNSSYSEINVPQETEFDRIAFIIN
jgi:hypothetical protein